MEKVFIQVLIVGAVLVLIGLATLLVAIPLLAKWYKDSDARTEFYSSRAAYFCVVVGLVILIIVAVGACALAIVRVLT